MCSNISFCIVYACLQSFCRMTLNNYHQLNAMKRKVAYSHLQYLPIKILRICVYFSLDFIFQLSFCFSKSPYNSDHMYGYVASTEIVRIIREIVRDISRKTGLFTNVNWTDGSKQENGILHSLSKPD